MRSLYDGFWLSLKTICDMSEMQCGGSGTKFEADAQGEMEWR